MQSQTRASEAVNYQTISARDLAKSVLSQGGWSDFLCSEKKHLPPVDLALVFVGRELFSSDIVSNRNTDPALLNLLKVSYDKSNFSMAFPYVAASENEAIENMLLSEFSETCEQDLGAANVAFSKSCSFMEEKFQKLEDLHAVHDHLISRMENRANGKADLVVFCHENSHSAKGIEQSRTESEDFSQLISSMETLGAKYAVLYVSDPSRAIQYPAHHMLERFLAEGAGNHSLNATFCDEVCQIKSSLLEGVLVAVVLLIILISGLCCMMGIDTPTRFETPQES
ncbi:hypothetical protein Tsubulata_020567 [Turnera subulata]|uniref:V-type proton ATPase subunit S1/VOA1 transmembrane domain-containing protein n=1 Tax=Turnera subulata TaxID=218843 RepID=A0A9Q0JAE3_9ROSI|nr:hypothetical protein Tsubulata_020567 [Turnera subulata]